MKRVAQQSGTTKQAKTDDTRELEKARKLAMEAFKTSVQN